MEKRCCSKEMLKKSIVIGTVTLAVPVVITFLDKVGYVARVEGASMQPVLNPGTTVDYVFLNRYAASSYKFNRGEVVSLLSPSNSREYMIKRVVAVEGDTVKTLGYKGKKRSVWMTIPQGHCWVEGDHHSHSMDSNMFGPVAMGLINSKASHIVWPPSRWKRLEIVKPDPGRFL